jgi:regulator of cell morphogenesis and NO signaling
MQHTDAIRWEGRPANQLADHIEQRYHAALRHELPHLIDAARQVERDHAARADVPVGLADVLATFWDEMQAHMYKEENILFPALRHGARGPAIAMAVQMMERDHEAHVDALAEIRAMTHDLVAPRGACAIWRALYDAIRALELDLAEHIRLENDILFRRAD